MTTKRSTPLARWGRELEAELTTLGASKRQLSRLLDVDYATLFKWLRADLTPPRKRRIDAAMERLRATVEDQPPAPVVLTGDPSGTEGLVAQLEVARAEMNTRIDAAVRALRGNQTQARSG